MLLLPSTAWGENYPITVAGVQVTDENAANVLNDVGTATVSFTPASGDNPATLTLNGATIDMSAIPGLCPIESSIANLTIQLIGYNTLTPNSDNINGIRFTTGTTTGNLTFTTSDVVEEYGSLSVEGIYQFSDLTSGYNVTNSFTTEGQTGWSKIESGIPNATYKYVKIDYIAYYDVWIGGARLSSSNLSPVSGGTKYIPSTHTLHLAGYGYGDGIKSGLPEFIVEVSGSNGVSNITFEGDTPGTIIFKKDESSLSGNKVDFTGSVKGFSSVTITPPLQLVSPSGVDNPTSEQWNSFTNVSIADFTTTYDITVAGVQVTDQNATTGITGTGITGTVTFTPAGDTTPATLTLTDATIIPTTERAGIKYTGTANLVISLNGTNNVVKGGGNCSAILYDGTGTPTLTFTNGGTEPCSMQLEAVGEQTIAGFGSVVNTGLYKIDETILGGDQPNTYKTTITSTILSGGSGTSANPFIIGTADDLKNFAKYVNDGILSTEYIKLGGNIDCTNLTGFEPIGNNTKSFIGTFNGDGNSITGLTFSNTNPDGVSGLFGEIGSIDTNNNDAITRGTVKNLTLNGCQFGNGDQNGAIAGYLHYGTIENCTVTSCTISSGNSQSTYSGGITGMVYNGIVKDCTVNGGTITSSITNSGDGYVYAGGIVAYAYSDSNINGCTVTDVSINSTGNGQNSYSGGIVGYSEATISGNSVEGTTTVNSINNSNNANLAGAIVAYRAEGSLTNNKYYFTVETQTKIGNNDPVEKSGYTQRAVGGIFNEEKLQYEDAPDIFEDNGAVLYTKPVVLPAESSAGAVTGKEGTYYIENDGSILVAPGQKAIINATPNAEEHYVLLWLKAVNASTEVTITNSTEITDQYSFDMPDAQVDVTAKFAIDLAAEGITATIANATCTGEALEPTTIAVEGITDVTSLTKDTDFTITGYTKGGEAVTSPIDVGTYTVSIEGKGDYTGTKDVSYTIEKGIAGLYFYHIKGDQEDPVQAVEVATYGTAYDSPRLKNPHNLPITFSCKAENSETGAESDVATIDDEGNVTILKAGTVYVYAIAAENDNYKELDKHYQLNIEKGSLANVTLTEIGDQVYTGTAIEPELTVTTPDGTSVTTDDYVIGYTPDNTNVGQVTITLTAKEGSEKFTGSTTTTFNIIPPTPTIAFDNTKTYLNTDKIAISIDEAYATSSATAGITNTIYYSWDENPVTGTEYPEGGVAAQTGTLTAWVSAAKSGTNYESEKTTQEFTVKTDISEYTVQGLATSATYTGAAIEPAFSVKASADAETSLTLNSDYTVSYQSVEVVAGDEGSGPSINYTDVPEMVEVGSYRIVITGTGDSYGGSTYANFAITKADLSIVKIENIADQTYTGSEIKPEITVKLNGNTLSASDYGFSIGYSNNINVATSTSANAPTVTITATGESNYFTAGTTQFAHFNIVQKSISDESISVTLSASSFTYNGDIQYPEITVKDGETTLTSEAYGYSYSQDGKAVDGPATAGTYTLTIYGEGNYTGEITKEITITPKEIATADITVTLATTSYTFDGTAHTPGVSSVTISDVTDPIEYEDAVYTNNVNAALATATENAPTVTVSLKGNYSGTGVATFTIEQADLSDYVVTGLTTPTAYTGSPITPTFSVKATETAETSLTANTDYSVKYQQAGADVDEMKDAGDYKIFITGEGNYKGSKSVDFTIDRAQLNLTINLEGWAYGDTPNEPSLEGNLGEGDITWQYKAAGAETYSAWSTLTTTTDAGTYMVKATVAETGNYLGGSAEKAFTIAQLDIADAVITLDKEELTYNGEQQTVNVTNVMAGNIEVPIDCYEVSGNTEKEAGDYKLTVTAKTMDSSGNPIKNNFTGSAEKVWKIKNRTVTTDELGLSENQSQATYYSETEDLEVPEGVVAYIITGVNGNNVVTQRIRYIKKGVAVFVEQTTSTENPLEVIPDASELPLKGTAVDLNVASISGGTVYVLYKGEFVKSTTGTIPAKRCYLLLPNNVAAGTRAFGIIGGGSDGSTAIKSINDEPSTIDNWYDMGGHRIEKPTKTGIYIKNGKKVAIK